MAFTPQSHIVFGAEATTPPLNQMIDNIAAMNDATGIDDQKILPRHLNISVADSAARLALTPFNGMLCLQRDNKRLYQYSGGAWELVTPPKKIGSFTTTGTTGNRQITGVGFKPKLVKFTAVPTAGSAVQSIVNSGAMDDSGGQYVVGSSARPVVSNRAETAVPVTNACIKAYGISSGGVFGTDLTAAYVSMDADGFTINFSATAVGYTVLWEAIG